MDHTPTKEQEKAFKSVIRAIKRAQKLGLRFYGKQWNLVAFTKQADDYLSDIKGYGLDGGEGGSVPYLAESVLSDSGADDYPYYATIEDEEKYNPDNY